MEKKTAQAVSFDGGKFQLRVDYQITNSAIKFRPYVVISDSFKKSHTATFSWKRRISYNAMGEYIDRNPHLREKYDRISELDIDTLLETEESFDRNLRYSGTYYAKRKKARKKSFKKKVKKKVKKKTKTVTNTISYQDDASGVEFANHDVEIVITLKVAGCSTKSTVKLVSNLKPVAPGAMHHSWGAGRQRMDLWVKKLTATPMKPVKSLELHRREETKLATQSWTHLATKSSKDMGGDSYGVISDIFWDYKQGTSARTFYDNTNFGRGKRFQWKVIAKNDAGQTQTVDSAWYYTEPPDPNNVSHERLSDKDNRVYFDCDRRDAYMNYVRNVHVEYTEKLPTDPNPNSAWVGLKEGTDFDWWATTKGAPAKWPGGYKTDSFAITHKNCQKDKHYRYRVYFSNNSNSRGDGASNAYSSYMPGISGTEPTYNEPNKPLKVTGLFDSTNNSIDISVERQFSYTTADKLYLQRKIDNQEWEYIPSSSGSEGIDITPQESDRISKYTDDDLSAAVGKEVIYRAAFGCTKTPASGTSLVEGNGISSWVTSAKIDVLVKPNPPVLAMPINNSFIIQGQATTRLGWIHSPNDGTAQTKATIQYRVNDGAWSSQTVNEVSYYDLNTTNYNANDVIEWKVSTKGQHKDFSDYSNTFKFKVYAQPEITITSPATNSVLERLPLPLSWSYEDASGTLKSMTFSILQDNDLLYEMDIPTTNTNSSGEGSINLLDYLFDNNESYELRLTVESTTSLSSETNTLISVNYRPFVLTKGYYISSEFDANTGYVDILLEQSGDNPDSNTVNGDIDSVNEEFDAYDDSIDDEEQPETSDAAVERILLYRTYNGDTTLIDSRTVNPTDTEGVKIEDRYAPLNVNYEYVLMQITTLGEVGISYTTQQHYSLWWYIYWGDNEITKARWNPTGSMSLNRPEKQQVRYSGRVYPVVYDSNANNETYSLNFKILEGVDGGWDDVLDFKNMMEAGGYGIWKSFEGDVYPADFDFSYNVDYTQLYKSWDCSLSVTRSESEEL